MAGGCLGLWLAIGALALVRGHQDYRTPVLFEGHEIQGFPKDVEHYVSVHQRIFFTLRGKSVIYEWRPNQTPVLIIEELHPISVLTACEHRASLLYELTDFQTSGYNIRELFIFDLLQAFSNRFHEYTQPTLALACVSDMTIRLTASHLEFVLLHPSARSMSVHKGPPAANFPGDQADLALSSSRRLGSSLEFQRLMNDIDKDLQLQSESSLQNLDAYMHSPDEVLFRVPHRGYTHLVVLFPRVPMVRDTKILLFHPEANAFALMHSFESDSLGSRSSHAQEDWVHEIGYRGEHPPSGAEVLHSSAFPHAIFFGSGMHLIRGDIQQVSDGRAYLNFKVIAQLGLSPDHGLTYAPWAAGIGGPRYYAFMDFVSDVPRIRLIFPDLEGPNLLDISLLTDIPSLECSQRDHHRCESPLSPYACVGLGSPYGPHFACVSCLLLELHLETRRKITPCPIFLEAERAQLSRCLIDFPTDCSTKRVTLWNMHTHRPFSLSRRLGALMGFLVRALLVLLICCCSCMGGVWCLFYLCFDRDSRNEVLKRARDYARTPYWQEDGGIARVSVSHIFDTGKASDAAEQRLSLVT